MKAIFLSKRTWLALALLAGLTGASWWQRTSVLAWYHVRQLSHACQDDCEGCAESLLHTHIIRHAKTEKARINNSKKTP